MMKILSSLHLTSFGSAVFVLTAAVCGLSACTEKKKSPPPLPAAEQKAEQKEEEKPAPLSLGHRFPIGPQLIFVPGKGVGPIRFGATVETIERHMMAPCDKKTESRCLYVRAAVEFFLEDGVLTRVKAHRRDRVVTDPPEKGEKYFGTLSGIVQPRIMLGLHRHVVLEELGEPKKKEEVSPPGPDGLVDRHFYEGINCEYDKIENGNTVLAAIEIVPSKTPHTPPAMAGELVAPPPGPLRPEPRAK